MCARTFETIVISRRDIYGSQVDKTLRVFDRIKMDWLHDFDEFDSRADLSFPLFEEDNTPSVTKRADNVDPDPPAAVEHDESHQTSQTAISPTSFLSPK
jgi:hypothetical protein